MFVNFKKEELVALHNDAYPNASKSTSIVFQQALNRIEKIFKETIFETNMSFCKDADMLMKKLKETNYSTNTILTTYTQVLKILKILSAPLNLYNSYLKLLKEETQNNQAVQLDMDIQKINGLLKFDEVKDKYIKFMELNKDLDFKELQSQIIFGLYLLQIPVRVGNYTNMKITELLDPPNQSFNYLQIYDQNYYFIFNKYKTSKILKQKTLPILDKNLIKLINRYLKINETDLFLPTTKTSSKLMTSRDISKAVEYASFQVLGEIYNVGDLRKIYIADLMEKDPSLEDKIDIASIMGYVLLDNLDKFSK